VPESLYAPHGELWLPTEATIGPWSEEAQHGGPPSMLLARELERVASEQPARVVRLGVELLRPVPLRPLRVTAWVARPGRRVDRVEAVLHDAEVEVARAYALRIRTAGLDVGPAPAPAEPPPAFSERPVDFGDGGWSASAAFRALAGRSYGALGVDLRLATGSVGEPGPATVWCRVRLPVVPGEVPTPLMRVAAVADFGNGLSWVLDPSRFSFVNPELTIHLARPPRGEWVALDAVTRLGGDGTGVAEGRLYDLEGRIGTAQQSLIIEPR
jgi:hypothetical protein